MKSIALGFAFASTLCLTSCSKEEKIEPVKPHETVVVPESFVTRYLQSMGENTDDTDEAGGSGPIIVIMCKCGGHVVHPKTCPPC